MRPDEPLFRKFSEHLETIDPELVSFCQLNGWILDKNRTRFPCRILEKLGNPLMMILLSLDGHWLKMGWEEDLPHKMEVRVYYEYPHERRLVKKQMIFEHLPFLLVKNNLNQYLAGGLQLLQSWTAPKTSTTDPDAVSQGWSRTRA